MWLAKQTGAPIAFSGGVGWAASRRRAAEAKIAAKIAADEFDRPIKWQEADSRDTRENASNTVALLKAAGIDHIVLVTHGVHMPRARRAFAEAAGPAMQIEAAPMGLARQVDPPALDWIPSSLRLSLHARRGARAPRRPGRRLSAGPPTPVGWRGSLALDYRRRTAIARSSTTATKGRCAC